ncbi:MAG: YgiQ family radical SAM protein, partial [Oscillospiraceae bacterium]
RFAHYDYWSDSVMPSIMVSAKADMISFGMGERQTEEIARRLNNGEKIESMTDIRGTVVYIDEDKIPENAVKVASFKKISEDKKAFAKAYKMELDEQDNVVGKPLVQKHGDRLILQNPPARLLTREELDKVYTLHFEGNYHPYYEQFGGVKAIEEVKFSIMHNRGCFGHCNFCSIAVHQGRQIVSRSIDSCLGEAEALSKREDFKGYIHDVGGPTADFRYPSCKKQEKLGMCKDRKCLGTNPCKAIICDHSEYLELLRKMRSIKGVKKVFIRSGLRFDYMLLDKDDEFLNEIVKYHISGQLRVAPEHCSKNVLEMMGKPPIEVYNKFSKKFYKATKAVGKEQYIVPYLMSSHPGSTINDAIELSLFLKKNNLKPEQVQDFYPTPFTISTCMFYTGINPLTMEEVYVPKTEEEKREQRALLQYYRPENHDTVLKALKTAKRFDLIGVGPNCLVADNIKNKKEVKIYRNNFAEPSLTTKGGRTKNHENKKKR